MKKAWLKLLSGVFALLLLINLVHLPGTVRADELGALEQQIEDLESKKADIQAQIKKLQSNVADQQNRMDAAVAEKNALDQEVFLLHEQANAINEQVSAYNLLIADKQVALEAAQARLSQLQDQHKDRIRAMEKNGGMSYWSVLFQAASFSEMLDQMRMIAQINQVDRQCLQELEAASREVAETTQALTEERAAVEEKRQELLKTDEQLQKKRQKADAAMAELLAMGNEYKSMIDEAESDMDGVLSEISKKQDEYDKAAYEQWLSTSVPETEPPTQPKPEPKPTDPKPEPKPTDPPKPSVPSSGWVVPVDYVYISSPFGTRFHPIDNVWRTHYGVDLAAYQGNPIYATRSGVVSTAAYGSSAGYHVYINHGDGFTSIYMHMTHYIVSPGQYVEAGQVIGYCGSTGASTGPHLHFGLTLNGQYVDPADYVNLH